MKAELIFQFLNDITSVFIFEFLWHHFLLPRPVRALWVNSQKGAVVKEGLIVAGGEI